MGTLKIVVFILRNYKTLTPDLRLAEGILISLLYVFLQPLNHRLIVILLKARRVRYFIEQALCRLL